MTTVCEMHELYGGNHNFPFFAVFQGRETDLRYVT